MHITPKLSLRLLASVFIALALMAAFCFIFQDELSGPDRWIRLPRLF